MSEEAARAARGVCAKCHSERVNFHFYLLWGFEPFVEFSPICFWDSFGSWAMRERELR